MAFNDFESDVAHILLDETASYYDNDIPFTMATTTSNNGEQKVRHRPNASGGIRKYDTAYDRHNISADPGRPPYIALAESQLPEFAQARNLTRNLRRMNKGSLIFALEDADRYPEFHKLLKLAPELRNCVYREYLCPLREGAIWGRHKQPPLTLVNRQVRQEALPVYYETCTFGLEMSGLAPYAEASKFLPPSMELNAVSKALLSSLPDKHFNVITKLELSIHACRVEALYCKAEEIINLQLKPGVDKGGHTFSVGVKDNLPYLKPLNPKGGEKVRRQFVQGWFEGKMAGILACGRWQRKDFADIPEFLGELGQEIKLQ